MGIIKDIYDLAKDGVVKGSKINAIKRALRAELKLNGQCLKDIANHKPIDSERQKDIIKMLELTELSAAVKYDLPYQLICRKKVGKQLIKKYKIKRLEGFDFEMLVESLYLKIAYLKKDFNNKDIDLNLRLINIYKYNSILIELLS